MSAINIISYWLQAGAVAIVLSLLIMSLADFIKKDVEPDFKILELVNESIKQPVINAINEKGALGAFIAVFATLVFWPKVVYEILTDN